MLDFSRQIQLFDNSLKQYAPFLYSKLQPPLNDEAIDSLFSEIAISDENIRTLYRWRNGIKYNTSSPAIKYEICSFGVILPLQEVSALCNSDDEDLGWDKHFIPLIGNNSGDYLLFNSDIDSETYGMIFLFSPSLLYIEEVVPYHDSLETMMQSISESFKAGAYKYDAQNRLDVDIDLQFEIFARLNPKSDYWNEYR